MRRAPRPLLQNYSTIIHTPGGSCTPDVTIALAGQPVPIPAAIRDSAVRMVTQATSAYGPPGPDLGKIPRTFPAFDGMMMDRVGRLWVSRQVGAAASQFEVYASNGTRVAVLDMPQALEPLRPMIIAAERVYGFVTDEDGLPYLVAYRIVK